MVIILGGWLIVHWSIIFRLKKIWQVVLYGCLSGTLLVGVLGSVLSVTNTITMSVSAIWQLSLRWGVYAVPLTFLWLYGLKWRLRWQLRRYHATGKGAIRRRIERRIDRLQLGYLDDFQAILADLQ